MFNKLNRSDRHVARRLGIDAQSPAPAFRALAEYTMPTGARSVHRGGDEQFHAHSLSAEQSAKRRHAVPAAIRLIYTATGQKTAFAKRTGA